MTVASASTARRRHTTERRRGIHLVLREIASRLQAPNADLRACFQDAAARTYGFDRVHLRDAIVSRPGGDSARGSHPWGRHVPGGGAVVSCQPPGESPDAWDDQQLAALADLAALVLEIDRRRGQVARAPARQPPVLVGASASMAAVRARIAQVARTPFPVLILGESGVGKEVVARLVHDQGRRSRGPFVAVNCAAIVETLVEAELFGIEDRTATGVRGRRGKFEQADGGTLFLDEIGDLAPSAQAKLLRALQDLSVERVGGHAPVAVDVRVVAATNRDLPRLVQEGRFRADLYYRLNGVEIEVPPLRDRLEDVPRLVAHVLEKHGLHDAVTVSEEALVALVDYSWPGNVRELERVVERALALCEDEVVRLEQLPEHVAGRFRALFSPALRESDTLRSFAARYVRLVLQQCRGNRREACRVLDISYHTLRAHLDHGGGGWEDPRDSQSAGGLTGVALVAEHAPSAFESAGSARAAVP